MEGGRRPRLLSWPDSGRRSGHAVDVGDVFGLRERALLPPALALLIRFRFDINAAKIPFFSFLTLRRRWRLW